jgi:TetR/AcrR family transcriptional regulator
MAEKKTQSRSRKTFQTILDTATKQFAQRGYEGARIDEIARQARVNKASLYYHFGDKSGLYNQVLIRVLGGISQRITENIKQASSHEERLRVYILTLSNNIGDSPHFAPILSRAIADTDRELPEQIVQQIMQVFGALFYIIEEGQADGRFRQVSPMVVYHLIVGGLMQYRAGETLRARISSLGETVFERKLDAPFNVAAGHVADIIVNSLRK